MSSAAPLSNMGSESTPQRRSMCGKSARSMCTNPGKQRFPQPRCSFSFAPASVRDCAGVLSAGEPIDCFPDAISQLRGWCPPEFRLHFRNIENFVIGAIGTRRVVEKLPGPAKQFANCFREFADRAALSAAEIQDIHFVVL